MDTSRIESGTAIWITGLPGSGKSTLAEVLALALRRYGRKVEILDGDAVRAHLSSGLGFSRHDRDTNVMRIAYVAHLLVRNGIVAVVAAVSPFRNTRERARALIGNTVEVHMATPLAECIRRDVKGLYAKALAGGISNFTGINDPYEEPIEPDLRLDASVLSLDVEVESVVHKLGELGYLPMKLRPGADVE
jgi:adenylylsulfate kinase